MANEEHLHFQRGGWEERSVILNERACGFKKIELSGHAQDQMQVRGVSEAEVLQVLRQPTRTDLPTQPGRKRYRWNKTVRSAIDVVWEPSSVSSDLLVVITVITIERRIVERKRR